MDGGSNESKKAMGSYLLQDGWPQSQAISASPDPASSQSWLEYFSPGEEHTRKEDESISLNFQPF